jgi:hypothetical protein
LLIKARGEAFCGSAKLRSACSTTYTTWCPVRRDVHKPHPSPWCSVQTTRTCFFIFAAGLALVAVTNAEVPPDTTSTRPFYNTAGLVVPPVRDGCFFTSSCAPLRRPRRRNLSARQPPSCSLSPLRCVLLESHHYHRLHCSGARDCRHSITCVIDEEVIIDSASASHVRSTRN